MKYTSCTPKKYRMDEVQWDKPIKMLKKAEDELTNRCIDFLKTNKENTSLKVFSSQRLYMKQFLKNKYTMSTNLGLIS